MGDVGKTIIGGLEIVAGVVTLQPELVAMGAVSVGSGIYGMVAKTKPILGTPVTVREALSPRRTIYGFCHLPAAITYLFSDEISGWLEQVHTIAGHECFKIGNDVYLDKVRVTNGPIPSVSGIQTGLFHDGFNPDGTLNNVFYRLGYYWHKTGAADDLLDGRGIASFPFSQSIGIFSGGLADNTEWDDSCRQTGCASAGLALKRSDHFNGLPSVWFDVWGKKVFDPRLNIDPNYTPVVVGRPTVSQNGGSMWGAFEEGVDQAFNWGYGAVQLSYTDPGNAIDGSLTTFSHCIYQGDHKYGGCIWGFGALADPGERLSLNILSDVPESGTDGYTVTARSAGIWYSLDGGTTWVQVYNWSKNKRWDNIILPVGQDLSLVRVMAFMDAHDHMYHRVFDINISTAFPWQWSDNPALCYLDYLTTKRVDGGFGVDVSECNLDTFIAAANICDENVDVAAVFTSIVSIVNDGPTFTIYPQSMRGILPGTTLSIAGEVTQVTDISGNAFFCVLTSVDGEGRTTHHAGEPISSTGAPTERRYTCNGSYTWDQEPVQIMGNLLSSMAGSCSFNGKYSVYAGAWRPPTITLTDADLRGAVKVQALRSARDLCNAVRGTFINQANNWQSDDFPVVTHNTDGTDATDVYLIADNGYRRYLDIQLPFTVSAAMAQRLASIALEQNRRQKTITWSGKMSCYELVPPDTVDISLTHFEF